MVLLKKNEAIAALRAKNGALLEQTDLLRSQLEQLRTELAEKQAESQQRMVAEKASIKELERAMVLKLRSLEQRLEAVTVENVALKKENAGLRQKLSLRVRRDKPAE